MKLIEVGKLMMLPREWCLFVAENQPSITHSHWFNLTHIDTTTTSSRETIINFAVFVAVSMSDVAYVCAVRSHFNQNNVFFRPLASARCYSILAFRCEWVSMLCTLIVGSRLLTSNEFGCTLIYSILAIGNHTSGKVKNSLKDKKKFDGFGTL